MKVTAEQLAHIREAIAPIDTDYWRDKYRAGDYPRAELTKDADKRYRWDLFHAAGLTQYACDVLYPAGCYDDHIDTALRAVVAPLHEKG